jgi:hypothetical protein
MQTQTAKMIYPTEAVAKMIAGKMTKAKGKHIVMKIATGFQVCPVTICQGAVSPNNAAPYPVKAPLTPASKPQVSDSETVIITLSLKKDTKSYLLIEKDDGKELWIGKSTIIDWDVATDGSGKVSMKFATKVAKQKGLI